MGNQCTIVRIFFCCEPLDNIYVSITIRWMTMKMMRVTMVLMEMTPRSKQLRDGPSLMSFPLDPFRCEVSWFSVVYATLMQDLSSWG
jgi:hypothetical protein